MSSVVRRRCPYRLSSHVSRLVHRSTTFYSTYITFFTVHYYVFTVQVLFNYFNEACRARIKIPTYSSLSLLIRSPRSVPPIFTLALHGLEEPAHASRGLEEPFLQLCGCVSFWFWQEIGIGCTYYYVLGVP